jgi:hypothetical protein
MRISLPALAGGYDEVMKFSIRDLFWVTGLCAVVAAWHIDHKSLTTEAGQKLGQWQKIIADTKKDAAVDRTKLEVELQIERKKVVALQDIRDA